MSKENYHRYPKDEKLKGIDYKFYNRLLSGKYDKEINQGQTPSMRARSGTSWIG